MSFTMSRLVPGFCFVAALGILGATGGSALAEPMIRGLDCRVFPQHQSTYRAWLDSWNATYNRCVTVNCPGNPASAETRRECILSLCDSTLRQIDELERHIRSCRNEAGSAAL